MKLADVKIGGTYMTRVSGELCRVVVVSLLDARPEAATPAGRKTRFYLRHEDGRGGMTLPKPRSAAALHPVES